jgi:hypothetical protein
VPACFFAWGSSSRGLCNTMNRTRTQAGSCIVLCYPLHEENKNATHQALASTEKYESPCTSHDCDPVLPLSRRTHRARNPGVPWACKLPLHALLHQSQSHNMSLVRVLVDPQAAVQGEPAIFYDPGDGTFCGNPAQASCDVPVLSWYT